MQLDLSCRDLAPEYARKGHFHRCIFQLGKPPTLKCIQITDLNDSDEQLHRRSGYPNNANTSHFWNVYILWCKLVFRLHRRDLMIVLGLLFPGWRICLVLRELTFHAMSSMISDFLGRCLRRKASLWKKWTKSLVTARV